MWCQNVGKRSSASLAESTFYIVCATQLFDAICAGMLPVFCSIETSEKYFFEFMCIRSNKVFKV
jgi:hypothetical protein